MTEIPTVREATLLSLPSSLPYITPDCTAIWFHLNVNLGAAHIVTVGSPALMIHSGIGGENRRARLPSVRENNRFDLCLFSRKPHNTDKEKKPWDFPLFRVNKSILGCVRFLRTAPFFCRTICSGRSKVNRSPRRNDESESQTRLQKKENRTTADDERQQDTMFNRHHNAVTAKGAESEQSCHTETVRAPWPWLLVFHRYEERKKTGAAASLFRKQTDVTLIPHASPTTWRRHTNPASVRRPSSGQDVGSGSKSTPELKLMQPD